MDCILKKNSKLIIKKLVLGNDKIIIKWIENCNELFF